MEGGPKPKYESKWPEGTVGWALEMVALGHSVRRRGDWIATRQIVLGGRDLRKPFSSLDDFIDLPSSWDVLCATDWEIVRPGIIEVLDFSRR